MSKELSLNEYQRRAMETCLPTANNFSYMMLNLVAEAGDILWQLSGLCSVMGWPLEDIAQANLDKLASRKRNVIDGNGDNR